MDAISIWAEAPSDPSRTARPDPLPPPFLVRLDSPLGRLEIASDGRAISEVHIARGGALPHDHLPETPSRLLDRAALQLAEYFAGERRRFRLPLHPAGTAFQLAVWEALRGVSFGVAATYGGLGAAVRRGRAGRAVGRAVAANPLPVLVPCHRVLGAHRRLTGYDQGDGLPVKRWLLRHEGIGFRE